MAISCDIIIPVWNELEATRECLESISARTDYPYRLIIIDNGSASETQDYLKHLRTVENREILIIRNSENLGFVKAANQGIVASRASRICIMNNDTVATQGWLAEMEKILETHPEIGIVNPSSNTSGQMPACGQTIEGYARGLQGLHGQIQELYACRGFCMLMRRDVIDKIGIFDEAYGIGYFEETELSYRAQKKGFKIARAKGAYVYHKESMTFKKYPEADSLFKKNEKIFQGRWGRRARVGFFIDRVDAPLRIDDIAASISRAGHEILIFLRRGVLWPVTIDHALIRKVEMPYIFFGFGSLYQVFKRKKKKPLDIVVADNKLLGEAFKAFVAFHGATVLVYPEKRLLQDAITQVSRVQ